MRFPFRLRTLLAACALTASVAACSDAASPTAAVDAAPRPGRMLSPGQASKVKPGDFIVYRPEEYEQYGISAFSASSATPSASVRCLDRPVEYDYVQPEYDGCGGQVCYDVNGGQIPCGNDPCYDRYGNNLCNPNPTPVCYDQWGNPTYNAGCSYPSPGAQATYGYGSSTPYDGQVNSGGVLLKQVRLISYSQSIANVASFTVDAAFKNVGAASGSGCNNIAEVWEYASAYGTGSGGYLELSRVAQWQGSIKWQVDGTHTFNPISGASGGGTFYSTSSFCG